MKTLPEHVKAYKRTATFTADSIPRGLLGEHNTRAGVWGKICVLEGEVLYRILAPEPEEHLLTKDRPGIVEPTVKHQLELRGPVTVYVEFFR